MKKKIEINISPDGDRITVEALDYNGNECELKVKELIRPIGIPTMIDYKQEYWNQIVEDKIDVENSNN
ncbi:MAG: hypothetical protein QXT45_05825 [Candidatus Bilamarchaeaceae archaeon]